MNTIPAAENTPLPAGLPHVAVILLWYPLFTQPSIFREVEHLRRHLPLTVYSLYGQNRQFCSSEMLASAARTRTLGLRALPQIARELAVQFCTRPRRLFRLFRQTLFHRRQSWEALGENCWAFFAGLLLARRLKEDGMDMIYAPLPRGAATAARVASQLAGIPYAVAVRGEDLAPADPDLADKLREALFVRVSNAADKERAETFAGGVARDKTELVHNCLPLSGEATCPAPLRMPVRLLALGLFDETKGFDVLLRACDILAQRRQQFTLTLAGGGRRFSLGREEKRLQTLRSQLGLENRVQFPGFISHNELPRLLMAHDIFVAPRVIHPSGRRDGIPNTVIEALSCGMPVVSSNIHALPEVVRNGETGLTVPPDDPEALADAIQWCMEHPDEARRLGRQGQELARKMFDPETNSRRLAEILVTHHAGRKA